MAFRAFPLAFLLAVHLTVGRVSAEPPLQGIWLMGQSLCEGAESLPVVTTAPSRWGNLAFQRGVRTWRYRDHSGTPHERAEEEFAIVPLQATVSGGLGETTASGLADHLKSLQGSIGPPHYLVAYAGQGGRGIAELSWADESVDPRTPENRQHGGGYYLTSLDDARRAKRQATSSGRAFAIKALVWMQGEANGGPKGGIVPSRWAAELPRPEGQAWYRDQLVSYRKQWSDDLVAITGQAGEIPMFCYQTLGPAGEAQLMAADADPDLFLVGPHYMVPSAVNSRYAGRHGDAIHLAADGERWYGEQVAKVMHRVLTEKEDWEPLRAVAATLESSRAAVLVDFLVPRPPLVVDTAFLPRQESPGRGGFASLAGFMLRDAQGAVVPLGGVEVVAANRLRLSLAMPVAPGGPCHLSYGSPGAGALGTLASVRPGPEVGGQPTTELLLNEAMLSQVTSLRAEGAFFVSNLLAPPLAARAPVRGVRTENEFLVLLIENRELRDGVAFTPGQALLALRPFSYGNLRDSDGAEAVYGFADASYGNRAGQRYPLWNWAVLFSGLHVAEQP